MYIVPHIECSVLANHDHDRNHNHDDHNHHHTITDYAICMMTMNDDVDHMSHDSNVCSLGCRLFLHHHAPLLTYSCAILYSYAHARTPTPKLPHTRMHFYSCIRIHPDSYSSLLLVGEVSGFVVLPVCCLFQLLTLLQSEIE